jgi:urease accessory protein
MEELVLDRILGNRADPGWAARLHELGHHGGRVETLAVRAEDLSRRRFRARTDHGTPCFIALPREAALADGDVLHLCDARAVVLKLGAQEWLRVEPLGDGGLELGYLAGNLHWRVRFAEGGLLVALDQPRETYLARLRELEQAGKARLPP